MTRNRALPLILLLAGVWSGLSGCNYAVGTNAEERESLRLQRQQRDMGQNPNSFFDLFIKQPDPDRGVAVNRYLWEAALDTVAFLPLDTADPFSGLIITGWGQVANAGSYRVTIYISDPALDARSLKVAAYRMQGGRAVAVSTEENRKLEDSILTRARQIRIQDTIRI